MSSNDLIEKKLNELEMSKFGSKYWNITQEQGEFLSNLIFFKKPQNVLEIGTSNGYSTLFLARNVNSGKIFTIEIDEDRFNEARRNFLSCELEEKIICLNDDVFSVLNDYDFGCRFDLVFVDAAQKNYREIVMKLEDGNLLNKGFVMIFDNISSHNYMEEFVSFMEDRYLCERIELGSGMLVCRIFNN